VSIGPEAMVIMRPETDYERLKALLSIFQLLRAFRQPIRVAISSDPRAATLERRYEMLGWLGLFLVVLGTICQIIGAVLSAT
jgi:hypothetical protein